MSTPARRLAALGGQLAADTAPAAAAAAAPIEQTVDPPALSRPQPNLLSDEDLQVFIRDGALELDVSELPPSFHAEMHRQAQEHHEQAQGRGLLLVDGAAGGGGGGTFAKESIFPRILRPYR